VSGSGHDDGGGGGGTGGGGDDDGEMDGHGQRVVVCCRSVRL